MAGSSISRERARVLRQAASLAKKLGPQWTPQVYETANGYKFRLLARHFILRPSMTEIGWLATVGPWTEFGKTPEEAIRQVRAAGKREIKKLAALIDLKVT